VVAERCELIAVSSNKKAAPDAQKVRQRDQQFRLFSLPYAGITQVRF
jgi:hypothetical protein